MVYDFHQTSRGCSINWIYIGSPSAGSDYSLITSAPKQFATLYPQEKSCLWVMSEDLVLFYNLFQTEILANTLIVKKIDFEELYSHPQILENISNNLSQNVFSRTSDVETKIFLERTYNWFFRVIHKISANNIIKELALPLIMANQAVLGTPSHYFDLSMLLLREFPSLRGLPKWPTFSIPINSAFHPSFVDRIHSSIRTRNPEHIFKSIATLLVPDVYWMYTGIDEDSVTFYSNYAANMIRIFLHEFPNVQDIIDNEVELENPQITRNLKRYLFSITNCAHLRDFEVISPERHDILGKILMDGLLLSLANLLISKTVMHGQFDVREYFKEWILLGNNLADFEINLADYERNLESQRLLASRATRRGSNESSDLNSPRSTAISNATSPRSPRSPHSPHSPHSPEIDQEWIQVSEESLLQSGVDVYDRDNQAWENLADVVERDTVVVHDPLRGRSPIRERSPIVEPLSVSEPGTPSILEPQIIMQLFKRKLSAFDVESEFYNRFTQFVLRYNSDLGCIKSLASGWKRMVPIQNISDTEKRFIERYMRAYKEIALQRFLADRFRKK